MSDNRTLSDITASQERKKMIRVVITKGAPPKSICWLCMEPIEKETIHVKAYFDEKGHVSTLTRAHMFCADDFSTFFMSENKRLSEEEINNLPSGKKE